jgi:hypothetical protein
MINKIATWVKQAVLGLALSLSVAPVAMATSTAPTNNIYTNAVYPAAVFTATSQTSAVITLGSVPSGAGGSYALGNVSVTGVGLTTVTFAVMGSSDGGNTYYALNVNAINAPATSGTPTTATTGGVYQVNLSGITNVEFVTSGTFTATSVSIVLTASPNGLIARAGAAGSANVNVANVFTQAQTAPAFLPPMLSPTAGPYVNQFDDFIANTISWNPGAIGSPTGNSAGTTVTNNTNAHQGVYVLISGTGGTGTGEYSRFGGQYFITNPSASQVWQMEWEVLPTLPGTFSGETQFGMTGTFPPAALDTTGLTFVLSGANGVVNDWYCSISGVQTDTTVAATAAWTTLDITNDGTFLHFYINGVEATVCKTAIGSGPTSAQEPVATATSLSASPIGAYIDYFTYWSKTAR